MAAGLKPGDDALIKVRSPHQLASKILDVGVDSRRYAVKEIDPSCFGLA